MRKGLTNASGCLTPRAGVTNCPQMGTHYNVTLNPNNSAKDRRCLSALGVREGSKGASPASVGSLLEAPLSLVEGLD